MSTSSDAQRPGSRGSRGSRRPSQGSRRPASTNRRTDRKTRTEYTTRTERSRTRTPRATDDPVSQHPPRESTKANERFVAGVNSLAATATAPAQPTGVRGSLARRWALWKPHIRLYGPQILINHAVALGVLLLLAVIVGIGAGFATIPATIGSAWMVANLAPIKMTGAELGFSPLLPALVLIVAHAKRATSLLGNSISIRGLRVFASLSLLIPLIITCAAWLMIWDASRVYDVQPPNLLTALMATFLVNGAAVVIGMRARVWRALLLRSGLSTWPVEAFRLAGRFLFWISAAGLAAAIVYLLTNLQAFTDAYSITDDVVGTIGLSFVALAYVPNIALGGGAILLGGEFHIGSGTASLFSVDNVNLPPVPVAAAIPNETIPYGGLLLIVPVVVSLSVVYLFVRGRGYVESPLLLGAGSGLAAAFIGFCVAWLSGGQLGVYGHTGPLAWLFAAELAAWLLVPAAIIMFFVVREGRKVTEDVVDAEQPVPVKDREDMGEKLSTALDGTEYATENTEEDSEENPTDNAAEDAAEENPSEGEAVEAEVASPKNKNKTETDADEDSDSSQRDGQPAASSDRPGEEGEDSDPGRGQ